MTRLTAAQELQREAVDTAIGLIDVDDCIHAIEDRIVTALNRTNDDRMVSILAPVADELNHMRIRHSKAREHLKRLADTLKEKPQ